ncbi:hypothetical protein PoB_002249600 [Plakobranchus ocellatus]|uniref:Uncharacterized protein n=1 Tax=Plakobranchus ocellatus TaxID=259542 RepID=A0AAV3Z9L8_9GAST|nr:hypothetical protein PoB_002249600 [Plakobranchus ocellatus]
MTEAFPTGRLSSNSRFSADITGESEQSNSLHADSKEGVSGRGSAFHVNGKDDDGDINVDKENVNDKTIDKLVVSTDSTGSSHNDILRATWSILPTTGTSHIPDMKDSLKADTRSENSAKSTVTAPVSGWVVTYQRTDLVQPGTVFAAPVLQPDIRSTDLIGLPLDNDLLICVAAITGPDGTGSTELKTRQQTENLNQCYYQTNTDGNNAVANSANTTVFRTNRAVLSPGDEASTEPGDKPAFASKRQESLEACTEWHRESRRFWTGLAASAVFLTPCVTGLIYVLYHDKRHMGAAKTPARRGQQVRDHTKNTNQWEAKPNNSENGSDLRQEELTSGSVRLPAVLVHRAPDHQSIITTVESLYHDHEKIIPVYCHSKRDVPSDTNTATQVADTVTEDYHSQQCNKQCRSGDVEPRGSQNDSGYCYSNKGLHLDDEDESNTTMKFMKISKRKKAHLARGDTLCEANATHDKRPNCIYNDTVENYEVPHQESNRCSHTGLSNITCIGRELDSPESHPNGSHRQALSGSGPRKNTGEYASDSSQNSHISTGYEREEERDLSFDKFSCSKQRKQPVQQAADKRLVQDTEDLRQFGSTDHTQELGSRLKGFSKVVDFQTHKEESRMAELETETTKL